MCNSYDNHGSKHLRNLTHSSKHSGTRLSAIEKWLKALWNNKARYYRKWLKALRSNKAHCYRKWLIALRNKDHCHRKMTQSTLEQ